MVATTNATRYFEMAVKTNPNLVFSLPLVDKLDQLKDGIGALSSATYFLIYLGRYITYLVMLVYGICNDNVYMNMTTTIKH